jgi:hypothetical protein
VGGKPAHRIEPLAVEPSVELEDVSLTGWDSRHLRKIPRPARHILSFSFVVLGFTIDSERIIAIDIRAEPNELQQLDLAMLGD